MVYGPSVTLPIKLNSLISYFFLIKQTTRGASRVMYYLVFKDLALTQTITTTGVEWTSMYAGSEVVCIWFLLLKWCFIPHHRILV